MTAAQENPLEIPFRIPFDRIRAEHVVPAVRQLLAEARGFGEARRCGRGRTLRTRWWRRDELDEPPVWQCGGAASGHRDAPELPSQ
jgi:hypothetical protein